VNVYAFTSGTVGRLTTGGLGGLSVRLHGDDGNRYYYAHLDGFADGIQPGRRVQAGDLLGFNGDSGNARGGPTHVHFQLRPNGGAPANPYRWLRAVCP
jgi:murein DD-endopeptidase MepM/ murein hydrolase activator NlpD